MCPKPFQEREARIEDDWDFLWRTIGAQENVPPVIRHWNELAGSVSDVRLPKPSRLQSPLASSSKGPTSETGSDRPRISRTETTDISRSGRWTGGSHWARRRSPS